MMKIIPKKSGRKQQKGARTLGPGWWKNATDVVETESLRRTNFQRIWKTFQTMAWEAKPHLQNVQYKPDGRARHFLGASVLTQIAEERKIDRKYQTDKAMPTEATYMLVYGKMDNVKDDKGVFHPDINGEYEHTKLKQERKGVFQQNIATIPGLENSYQFDPRYISAIVPGLTTSEWNEFYSTVGKDFPTHADSLLTLIKGIHSTDPAICKFKYHKPIFHKHTTVDYNIYTVRMTAESDALDRCLVKIHRRMIIVESSFPGKSFKLPLAEELFIELYKKPENYTIGHPVCLDRSIVIACNLVQAGSDHVSPTMPTCASMLHFFGQNAFTVDVANCNHNSKLRMGSTHNLAAFMAGWLIRKMSNISNEFEKTAGTVFDTLKEDPYLKARATNAVKLKLKRSDVVLKDRDVLQYSFLNRQGAKSLLDVDGKKIFYVTLWLATPTMAIVCVSPLEDSRKANVFVWTMGNGENVPAELPRELKETPAVAIGTDGAQGRWTKSSMSRPGMFSRRLFEHQSTLPDELELELQSL
jgi:hypothetical protein